MGGTEQNFVDEAFATNWVAPLGPNVDGFEKDLENYLGEETHVAVVSTGTAALRRSRPAPWPRGRRCQAEVPPDRRRNTARWHGNPRFHPEPSRW